MNRGDAMDELQLTVFDTDDGHRGNVLWALAGQISASHRWRPGAFRQLFVSLCDSSGAVRGGLLATTHGEWLEIEFVWVTETARCQGWATRMLAAAEMEAVERGCRRACLDTGCSDADGFFRRHGYHAAGELANYHSGRSRFWMTKNLT